MEYMYQLTQGNSNNYIKKLMITETPISTSYYYTQASTKIKGCGD